MNDVVNPDTYETLAISPRENGLYVVTLNRPTKRNALDVATIEELIEVAKKRHYIFADQLPMVKSVLHIA